MSKTEEQYIKVTNKCRLLFENKMKSGNRYFGRDEYFNSVIVESRTNLIGMIKSVEIFKVNQNTLFGKLQNNMKAA